MTELADELPAPTGAAPRSSGPRRVGDSSEQSDPPPNAVAGSGLRAAVRSVDRIVDDWFEPHRGRPALDGAAKLITGLGDHGFVWAAITAWRARRPGPERVRAVRALTVAGIESSLVNRTLKQSIGRSRPDRTGLKVTEGGMPVREPTTSSFPSGHTLAAFCAATVMCRANDRVGNGLLLTTATVVGLSRLHLRAHHASDVVGGAVIGTTLGLLGRRLV